MASDVVQSYRPMKDNLRIWVFAQKHSMTIAQVEELLNNV